MSKLAIIVLLQVVALAALAVGQGPPQADAAGGYRPMPYPPYPDYPSYPGSPCGGEQCPPGQFCQLVQVYCITAPCPPVPMCRPWQRPTPPNHHPCAAILCAQGTTCVPPGQCVPNGGPGPYPPQQPV